MTETNSPTRVLLVALYSDKHPAIGETLALSVLGGCLEGKLAGIVEVELLDLYSVPQNREEVLVGRMAEFQPHILGFSVTFGTLNFLRTVYGKILEVWQVQRRLTIFGGAIPTYIPDQFVPGIESDGVVVIGEGDEAIIEIVKAYRKDISTNGINNTYSIDTGKAVWGPRQLVNLERNGLPKRSLTLQTVKLGGQVFVETSRGCTWGSCTFCKRGLTDIRGVGTEYRRFPVNHVVADIEQLNRMGISNITFADEEFLGHTNNASYQWLTEFQRLLKQRNIEISFDISVMVQSVIVDAWDKEQANIRTKIWDILEDIGLRKVFLGIESGSDSQLKRYAKNATAMQNAMAIALIRQREIDLECGFIMFDPLCNLTEIRENIEFVRNNNLIGIISSLNNEMRIDHGSRYHQLLLKMEGKHKLQLFQRDLDITTLTYPPLYLHKEVTDIIAELRVWRQFYGRLHYISKSLSRYGQSGAVGPHHISFFRDILLKIRRAYFQSFSDLVMISMNGDDNSLQIREEFFRSIKQITEEILEYFSGNYGAGEKVSPMLSEFISLARIITQRE